MCKILNEACNKLSKILNYKKATLGPVFYDFCSRNSTYQKSSKQPFGIHEKLGSDSEVQAFAEKCGTTKGNLLQIAYGGSVSPILSKKISNQSGGEVLLSDLRPDIFSET